MKKLLRLTFTLIVSTSIFSTSQAQNNSHNWGIEVSGGYMEYVGDLGSALFFAQEPNYQGVGVSLGRYLTPTFDAILTFGVGDLGYYGKTDWLPAPEKYNGFRANIINGQAGVRIKLANDMFISSDALIQPYFQATFGGVNIYSKIVNIPDAYTEVLNSIAAGGGGINLNFSERFSVRLQTMFNYTFNDNFDGFPWSNGVHKRHANSDAFMFHSLGVAYHFGAGAGGGSGIKTMKDSDNDGIPNKYDKCKNTREDYLVDSTGCDLDTDGDGIVDSEDKCPKVAGVEAFEGCPDTDGDGIADSEDACPKVAGTAEGKGCPDTDGDGVYDNVDKCPNVKGLKEKDGCPRIDTDGDGVYDDEDKCKTTKGDPSNFGCPVIKEDVKEKIALAAQGIFFETSSDKIKASSFTNLDNLAELLNEYPDTHVEIEGHTDSDGDADANLDLSQRRADAVLAYLSTHGIVAKRMHAQGFGETKPIAENTSRAGKAKNRRVDFKLTYE